MWLNILCPKNTVNKECDWTYCHVCAYPFVKHEIWHQHTWGKKKGSLQCRASYQPFLIHTADTYASDLRALLELGFSTTNLVYLSVTGSLQGQSPSIPSTLLPCCSAHQEIRTYFSLRECGLTLWLALTTEYGRSDNEPVPGLTATTFTLGSQPPGCKEIQEVPLETETI